MDTDRLNAEMQSIARHLADTGTTRPETGDKLSDGMKRVPARQMMEQVQYLNEVLLPKAESQYGPESENTKFYARLLESLLWAMHIHDRYDFLQTRYLNKSMEAAFYRDLCTKYERELQKYTTLEDLMFSASLNDYNQTILNRAEALKKQKNL